MVAKWAWMPSKRRWMRSPASHTLSVTIGSGSSENSVSRGLIATMNPIDTIATTTVFTRYMRPGPSIMRTADRSFVARDRISPVRVPWKYSEGRVWRCSNTWLRRSNSRWREMPITTWRIQNLNTPETRAIANSRRA